MKINLNIKNLREKASMTSFQCIVNNAGLYRGENDVPPVYGPSALLYCTRNPRLTRLIPASSIQATRKVIVLSGSNN